VVTSGSFLKAPCGEYLNTNGVSTLTLPLGRRGIKMAHDPVCKMPVDEDTARWTSEYKDQKYYFCAEGCKEDFDDNPEWFLKGGGTSGHHC
jgi:YHS domain-containing protein